MSSLSEYRTKLVNNILHAGSPEDVQSHIETAISYLKQKNVNGRLIIRLVDKLNQELELLNLLDGRNAAHEHNIKTAGNILTRIKNQMESAPG